MNIHLHTNIESISSLREEWLELESSAPNIVLFQSWAWCSNVSEFSKVDAGFSPYVIAVREGEQLLALLPLCLQRIGRQTVLTGLCEPFQHYTDILVSKNANVTDVSALIFKALKDAPADYCHFGQVREDSVLADVVRRELAPFDGGEFAPSIELSKYKPLDETNEVGLKSQKADKWTGKDELLSSVIESVYEKREAWYARLGITSRAYANTDLKGFLDTFKKAPSHQEQGTIEAMGIRLTQNDVLVSDQLGFVYKGRFYNFMSGFGAQDANWVEALHNQNLIKSCIEQSIETLDFLSPATANEQNLCQNNVCVQDYLMPISFKGRLFIGLWLKFLKPIAKKLLVR
ncbi:MAG: GNAT family N-acetyltransferase [Nitratireductor sp.]